MTDPDRLNARDLDRYITGNYGEDSVPNEPVCVVCGQIINESDEDMCRECIEIQNLYE